MTRKRPKMTRKRPKIAKSVILVNYFGMRRVYCFLYSKNPYLSLLGIFSCDSTEVKLYGQRPLFFMRDLTLWREVHGLPYILLSLPLNPALSPVTFHSPEHLARMVHNSQTVKEKEMSQPGLFFSLNVFLYAKYICVFMNEVGVRK